MLLTFPCVHAEEKHEAGLCAHGFGDVLQLLAAAAYARHGCLSEHASLIQKAYVVPFSAFQAGSYRAPRRI